MSSPSLSDLPSELLLLISSRLQRDDRVHFASTNSIIRQLLLPVLFSTIAVTNRAQDLDGIRAVISKHGHLAKRVLFQCYWSVDQHTSNKSGRRELRDGLPEDIVRLLSGKTLSHVHAFSVMFKLFDENGVDTKEIWHALASNTSSRSLDLINLPDQESSAWAEDSWKAFLARLERLSVHVWGGDNGVGWQSNSEPQHKQFMTRLGENFFEHASNVKHLCIASDAENPYGLVCAGQGAKMGLEPNMLGSIESLEFECCLLNENMIEFLKSRSGQIKELTFNECHSCDTTPKHEVRHPSWGVLFAALVESKPVLEKLTIKNSRIPLSGREQFPYDEELDEDRNFIPPDDEDDDIREFRAEVKASPKRLFSYATLGSKYAACYATMYTAEHFQEGKDDAAYQELLALVAHNAERSKNEVGQREQVEARAPHWRKKRPFPETFVFNAIRVRSSETMN